ncbi:MAG TPA: C2 family cysteine protease [Polyangiales bacterium]|nr:C2 family cysteine protease [Polyangiales bacterium]
MSKHKLLAGVINPYALAEVALNRAINWKRVKTPLALLERTLGTPAGKLFDPVHHTVAFALAELEANNIRLKSTTALAGGAADARKARGLQGLDVSEDVLKRLLPFLGGSAAGSPSDPFTPAGASWRDVGDYFEEGSEFFDPVQGAVGDCYLIAALASVAWSRPYVIVDAVRQSGASQPDTLHRIEYAISGGSVAHEVSERVPVRMSDSWFFYARSSEAGEIWPCIYEKAYAKIRSGNTSDQPPYDPMTGGDPVAACAEVLRGGSVASYTGNAGTSADDLWTLVRANSLSYRTVNPMTAWTYGTGDESPDKIKYDDASGIVGWHAYSVLGWDYYNNEKYIVLRNPWGQHEGKVDIKSGPWSAYDVSFWRSVTLNSGGVFAMKAAAFKKYFAGIGVAK